jgi:hypothetical protein
MTTVGLSGCFTSPLKITKLEAGPFSVSLPLEWSRSAIIEKVPIQPVYTPQYWTAYQNDRTYALKPGYNCRPQHWAIRIPAVRLRGEQFDPNEAGDDATAPQILIHKANEWGLAFSDGIHSEFPTSRVVRKLRRDMESWEREDLAHGSPAFMDASLTFVCLKQRIAFQGGHGIRMVAQWTVEPDLVQRGALHYLFLGMSDDDTCQIIATFPLDVDGLPSDKSKKHLGRSIDNYAELTQNMDAYEADAKSWLETRASQFTPSLQKLDAMMSSLFALHWS